MKRIIVLLLALTMLLTLAAPALALETIATGEYPLEVNLAVPDDGTKLGGFKVIIPDSLDLQFGVMESSFACYIEIDPERIAYGQGIGIDVAAANDEYFYEWENEDGSIDNAIMLNGDNGSDSFHLHLYANGGERAIEGAPFGWEERDGHLKDGYERFVCNLMNFEGEPTNIEENVKVTIGYPENVVPGNYHSELTFNVFTNWMFNYDNIEENGYRFVINDGFEDRMMENYEDETAAFDEWGWPIDGRVLGIEPIEPIDG